MRFLRRNRYILVFFIVLILCDLLFLRQLQANQSRHIDLREDFILLTQKGHITPAQHLYQVLVQSLSRLPNSALLDDYQRTLSLVDPNTQHPDNLVWQYHWAVKQHLEKRAESRLPTALKRAEKL